MQVGNAPQTGPCFHATVSELDREGNLERKGTSQELRKKKFYEFLSSSCSSSFNSVNIYRNYNPQI